MSIVRPLSLAACIACGVAVFHPGDARAVELSKVIFQNGTGSCGAALPAFEGLIRKRPLAIQNEGTQNAFVSCSLVSGVLAGGGSQSADGVFIGIINAPGSANSISVTCTLANGIANSVNPTFIVKSTTVAPGASSELSWTAAADNAGARFQVSPSVSCALPPGTGVSYTFSRFPDNVGQ